MADAEMSVKEERHPVNPLNHEEGNLRDREIQVDLNDSQDNKSKLQRTVKELSSGLRKVKEDNEQILNDKEELDTILLKTIKKSTK